MLYEYKFLYIYIYIYECVCVCVCVCVCECMCRINRHRNTRTYKSHVQLVGSELQCALSQYIILTAKAPIFIHHKMQFL